MFTSAAKRKYPSKGRSTPRKRKTKQHVSRRKKSTRRKSFGRKKGADFVSTSPVNAADRNSSREGHVIGSSDFSDINAFTTYNWEMKQPRSTSFQSLVDNPESKRLKSLRHLCAEKIASNTALLHPSYLESWEQWKHVWAIILREELDSPAVFGMFAKRFCDEKSFNCHPNSPNQSIGPNGRRQEAIQVSTLKSGSFHHRIENVFSNFSSRSLSSYFHQNGFKLALDISICPKYDFQSIFQLSNLTALDISGHRIDDGFIKQLANSIAESPSRFAHLKILSIMKCEGVSKDGVKYLLAKQSHLNYLETDHFLVESAFVGGLQGYRSSSENGIERFVQNTRYKYLPMETTSILNLPLGLKLLGLNMKQNLGLKRTDVVVDVLVDPESFTGDSQKTWQKRIARRNTQRIGFCYILDLNRNIDSRHSDTTQREVPSIKEKGRSEGSVFKVRKREPSQAEKPQMKASLKPRLKNLDVKKFFDLQ